MRETAARLLLMQVDSWMTGVNKNVAGRRKHTFMACAGGGLKYRQKCDEVAVPWRRRFQTALIGGCAGNCDLPGAVRGGGNSRQQPAFAPNVEDGRAGLQPKDTDGARLRFPAIA